MTHATAAGRSAAVLLAVCLAHAATPANALACQANPPAIPQPQTPGTLEGRVIDEVASVPVTDAAVTLRSLDVADGSLPWIRRVSTDANGHYRFTNVPRGNYELSVQRFGYRETGIVVTLQRDAPLFLSILLEPAPFQLDPVAPDGLRPRGPMLVEGAPGAGHDGVSTDDRRAAAVRARQQRFLSADVRQLGRRDVREANTLAEDDVFRALQSAPGVARRDDFTADLWTRGAAAGQTLLTFDGIPVIGALHALGALSGLNADMLRTATFQPGVAPAASPGGGAASIDVVSRSPANAPRSTAVALSPISARFMTDAHPSERFAWAIGIRRSHIDLLSAIADVFVPGDGALRYAFADLTTRADLVLTGRTRIEASAFVQEDRVYGEVADVARGNEGTWGTGVARVSIVTGIDEGLTLRHTLGVSDFDASVHASSVVPAGGSGSRPLHPTTKNGYRTLQWESRLDGARGPESSWSLGLMLRRELHEYNGPGIDPASLLTPEHLARRGVIELTPIVLDIARSRLVKREDAMRAAFWGSHRGRITPWLEYEAGVRAEAGERVQDGTARLAPRLHVRLADASLPLTVSAGYGRAYQYTQSIARTDVLRPGLRASEVLMQAGRDTPALSSDVVTLGVESWVGRSLLIGATAWWRGTAGVLLPSPGAGPLDRERGVTAADGSARGVELSARQLDGPVRGFANYSLSRSMLRVGSRTFAASEDRRHVANIGMTTDVQPWWQLGGTLRVESGAPYTRVTFVSTPCRPGDVCEEPVPVLLGTPGGQRAPGYASLDLMTEWTHAFGGWSLSLYGQVRNTLGSANAVTYHSSCVCIGDASANGGLADRFEPGLPRMPVIGLRARF